MNARSTEQKNKDKKQATEKGFDEYSWHKLAESGDIIYVINWQWKFY